MFPGRKNVTDTTNIDEQGKIHLTSHSTVKLLVIYVSCSYSAPEIMDEQPICHSPSTNSIYYGTHMISICRNDLFPALWIFLPAKLIISQSWLVQLLLVAYFFQVLLKKFGFDSSFSMSVEYNTYLYARKVLKFPIHERSQISAF